MSKGKFFVFEGIDGSGKSTQSKLFAEYLKEKGFQVEKIDFPQYGKKSAGLLENYLQGLYGESSDVGPYKASIFYACDRYDLSFQIKKWLEEGKMVVSDRYVVSNLGHQGGKLIDDEKAWNNYVDWLYDLEYRIFEIPRPDYTFILKTSAELSQKMSHRITDEEKKQKRIAYLGDDKKQDIHEKDLKHLADTLKSYTKVAEKYPEEFRVIECIEQNAILSIEIIHKKIIQEAEKIINKIM